jgi:adenylate cyclase
VAKVRLAVACERAGLPTEGIAAAIRAGRLSFAFLEVALFRRWAVRSVRAYRAVSQETGVPLELLRSTPEAMGFAPATPEEPMREDELEVVTLLQLVHATGVMDRPWMTRVGRGYAEGMRLIARVESEAHHPRFELPALESGADQRTAMDLAARLGSDAAPLVDRALLAIYRRQQELAWTERLVEDIETALDAAGVLGRPGRVPAICFLDLVGYTRLTEERGDQAAVVNRRSREHGGMPVKWLGDGVMVHFRDPAGAVLAALRMVEQLPAAGLPPAHVGVAAGPVVVQGGGYYGRTVNLAARIADRAGAGQVLVAEQVVATPPARGVTFVELGQVQLQGISRAVRCWKPAGRDVWLGSSPLETGLEGAVCPGGDC